MLAFQIFNSLELVCSVHVFRTLAYKLLTGVEMVLQDFIYVAQISHGVVLNSPIQGADQTLELGDVVVDTHKSGYLISVLDISGGGEELSAALGLHVVYGITHEIFFKEFVEKFVCAQIANLTPGYVAVFNVGYL